MNTTQTDNVQPVRRWSRALLVPCAALALGFGSASLVGCGGGDDTNDDGSAAGGTRAAVAEPTPSSNGAQGIDASPSDASTQGTVGGTLALFIGAMEEGAFEEAIHFVDESTDLHSELLKMIENVETASNIDDPQVGNMGDFVRLSFAVTFAGADYEIVSEDDSRARAMVTLPGANDAQRAVDLNRVDGNWFIVAGRELISSGGTPPPIPPRPAR